MTTNALLDSILDATPSTAPKAASAPAPRARIGAVQTTGGCEGLLLLANGSPAATYAKGRGLVGQSWSPWHRYGEVLDVESLDSTMVDPRLLPEVYLAEPLDPETGEVCEGLSLIKARSFRGRLGFAGGHKRTQWTPAQPADAFATFARLREVGATVESCQWLKPGRLVIDGSMPVDARFPGDDRHVVRFCAVLNYTGSGTDRIYLTTVRVVCVNTERAASMDANKRGSVLKVRHDAGIADAYHLDVPAFLGQASEAVVKLAAKKAALDARRIKSGEELARYFEAVVGTPPKADDSVRSQASYARKLQALAGAYEAERENARKVGLSPDSLKVAYEAVTNVASHGGIVDTDKGQEWRPILNKARNPVARTMATIKGEVQTVALDAALAMI